MADKKGNRYSVYQGLDTDPSINWGTVASTISDQLTLLKEAKLQERDAIDKATQDQMDQLNKLPDVNDRSLSKIVLEAIEKVIEAIEICKNNCFKIDIHLMPDLPYSNMTKDTHMFNAVYSSDKFQPDQIKVYPCEVVPWTKIEKWHKDGKYNPYDTRYLNIFKWRQLVNTFTICEINSKIYYKKN